MQRRKIYWFKMNRKERRAAQTSSIRKEIDDVSQIPLAPPPASGQHNRQGKTLIELAAERQAALAAEREKSTKAADPKQKGKTEYVKVGPDGKIIREDGTALPSEEEAVDEEMPPLPDTILTSFPLAAVHLILSYVAMLQYAEDVDYPGLFIRSGVIAFPTLTLVIHFAHGHIISFEPLKKLYKRPAKGKGRMFKPGEKYEPPEPTFWQRVSKVFQIFFPLTPKTFFFLPFAIFFGVKLIKTTNEKFYYANMKTAPSLGTLWVWAIVELGVGPALLAFVIPVTWAYYFKGYTLW